MGQILRLNANSKVLPIVTPAPLIRFAGFWGFRRLWYRSKQNQRRNASHVLAAAALLGFAFGAKPRLLYPDALEAGLQLHWLAAFLAGWVIITVVKVMPHRALPRMWPTITRQAVSALLSTGMLLVEGGNTGKQGRR